MLSQQICSLPQGYHGHDKDCVHRNHRLRAFTPPPLAACGQQMSQPSIAAVLPPSPPVDAADDLAGHDTRNASSPCARRSKVSQCTRTHAADSAGQNDSSYFTPRGVNMPPLSFRQSEPLLSPLSFTTGVSPQRSRKRGRSVTDVDGENSCIQKKKRRLRLFLITSRLSPQFSHPASNIADRGQSKVAIWSKQRALGRNLLYKAAILNRIRRHAISTREAAGGLGRVLVEQEKEQAQLKLARMTFTFGSHDSMTRPIRPGTPSDSAPGVRSPISSRSPSSSPELGPQEDNQSPYQSPNDAYSYAPSPIGSPLRSFTPLPPSPLGLSNYDAFDVDDEDPYAHLDDDYGVYDDEDDGTDLFAYPRDPGPSAIRNDSGAAMMTPPRCLTR